MAKLQLHIILFQVDQNIWHNYPTTWKQQFNVVNNYKFLGIATVQYKKYITIIIIIITETKVCHTTTVK